MNVSGFPNNATFNSLLAWSELVQHNVCVCLGYAATKNYIHHLVFISVGLLPHLLLGCNGGLWAFSFMFQRNEISHRLPLGIVPIN